MKKQFAVFGLGSFGRSVALTLENLGCDVVVVDKSYEKIQEISDMVSYAMRADVSDPDALHALGGRNLDGAVVAVSESLEASIMATIISKEMGIPYVLAKAKDELQGAILEKVGADAIAYPECDMGERVAKSLMSTAFADWIELSSEYSMAEVVIPEKWVGRSLSELKIREQYGINVVGIIQGVQVDVTLDPYEPGDLSQMLSEQILSAMTGADALFLNQEFSISSKGEALSGKTSILHANAERMNILEALGADVVSLGNEHAAGYGQDALKENMELLKNAGMAYVGAGTDAADAAQPVYLIINGIKIGFTSASGMEDSYDMAAGDGKAGILEYTEAEQYTKVIQEAATKCDYLIVYDHEGKGDANGVESYQKEHAAAFLQAGADIVIGGHSDRLQGIEYIDGKPVVYSIGSVLTDGTSRYSAVLKLNITSEGLKEMSLVPGIQTEDMTEYLDSTETQKKMYDAVAALCPNASIDENGVVTEKK
jgi:Trk K+ transport system NAD-binding subunit